MHGTAVGTLGAAFGALSLLLPLPETTYFPPSWLYASVVCTVVLGYAGGLLARPAA